MSSTRILVVEDAADLREEVNDYLRFFGFEARAVGSLAEMRKELAKDAWDILLLDLGLPDGDGLMASQQVRQEYGFSIGIIMTTARGHIEDRVAGLSGALADAYLVKPVNLRELKAVIDQLMARMRESAPPGQAFRWSIQELTLQLRCPNSVLVELTGTEALLLKKLFSHEPGSPISREQLSQYLAPEGTLPNTRRLDTLVSRLRSKVERESGLSLPIFTFRNLGYAFKGNPAE